MENRMSNHFDESAGAITGVFVWVITHIWSFPMLQVPTHPIASERNLSSKTKFATENSFIKPFFFVAKSKHKPPV